MKLSQRDLGSGQATKPGRRTVMRGVFGGRFGALALAAWTGGCAHVPAIHAQPKKNMYAARAAAAGRPRIRLRRGATSKPQGWHTRTPHSTGSRLPCV